MLEANTVKKFSLILLICFTLIFLHQCASKVYSAELFTDTFTDGYSSSWQVPDGAFSPVASDFGITGSPDTSWSVIHLPLTQNMTYKLMFDLKINEDGTNHTWGAGITNQAGSWKFTGRWHDILQIHDSNSVNSEVQWNHSPGIHRFEILVSPEKDTIFSVTEDGVLLGSIITTAEFNVSAVELSIYGHGVYEMANFSLLSVDIPTQTPTPTPTPTPAYPKKVIIVPGMGGSWNQDAMIGCKLDNYDGPWSDWIIADLNVYESLKNNLAQAGYLPDVMYYDWRQHVNKSAEVLDTYISERVREGEKVDLVGHSLGGLVSTAYLKRTGESNSLEKLVTVGSPHQGSVFAYPAWSGGEMWLDNNWLRIGTTVAQVLCKAQRGWTNRQTIQNVFPSVQNVLPIFDYLTNTDGTTIPVSTMNAQNNWLPSRLIAPFYGVDVATFAGSGYETLKSIEVTTANRLNRFFGNWRDGQPTGNTIYDNGDGTVLTKSSFLPGTHQHTMPLEHTKLVTDQQGIDSIINFLNGTAIVSPLLSMTHAPQTKPITTAEQISALVIVVDGAHATLTDKNDNTYKDSEGQITILNPHDGEYTLRIEREKRKWWKSKYSVYVIQMYEDGTHSWKEYKNSHGWRTKYFKIRFGKKHRNHMLYDYKN